MTSSKASVRFGLQLLKCGASVVALTAMATAAMPAAAQTAPANGASDGGKEVVVVGVRRSLKTAQQIKRDAETVVDSITATDIGSFPDKSVAEALQRVAGVTVSRYAAADDTAHFSAEPSGVLVRGLPQVRSEFNGRDVFSANSSRGLGWSDVSPELMGGVDTYKNQTADLIEGGIAGSINLRTRLPFDSKGRLLALSIDGTYGDLAKKWEPDVSGIYSDRFDTSLGEFGVMVNAAYSKVMTGANVIQYGRMGIFCSNNPGADLSQCDTNQFGITDSDTAHNFAYASGSLTYRDQKYDRERKGVSAAVQWQNHEHSMLATLQFNSSSYDNQMHEHAVGVSPFGLWAQPLGYQVTDTGTLAPVTSPSDFVFDSQGLFQSGTLTTNHGWFGASDTVAQNQAVGWGGNASDVAVNDQGVNMYNSCQQAASNAPGCSTGRQAAAVNTISRYSNNLEQTSDVSFNLKWDVNDKIKTNFDVQYVYATVQNYDIEVGMNSNANVYLDATGDYPKITFNAPTNVNESAGGLATANNYYYNYVMDHAENSKGKELAVRGDLQYVIDKGWLDTLRVGVRYSDRDQHVNWSTYNWKNIANTYSCNAGYYNIDITSTRTWQCNDNGSATTNLRTFSGYDTGMYEKDSFGDNFMRSSNLLSQNQFYFLSDNILDNRQNLINVLSQSVLDAKATGLQATNAAGVGAHVGSWVPLCQRTQDAPGSCYTPAEIMQIEEKTEAAYAMLKFGGNDHSIFGFTVSGNVGVRYVHTEDTSTGGGIKYPDIFEYTQNNCDSSNTHLQNQNNAANDVYPVDLNCIGRHSVADSGGTHAGNPDPLTHDYFSDGAIVSNDPLFPAVVKATHNNWLPSFNIKFNLTDQWILRFAASRAMSRPDMGLLKNYFYVTRAAITSRDFPLDNSNPNVTYGDGNVQNGDTATATSCAAGAPCSYKFQYTASAGNPNLRPTTADQFDLVLENYFAQVGSFSFDLFYKKFHDYIQNGARQSVTLTHNGVTRDVLVTGPVNGDGASIKGFEVSYQRFFDFLPSPFDGLGIQTNYTKVINTGINNAGLRTNFTGGSGLGTGGGGVAAQFDSIDPHALEGVSKDSFNFIGMYEKGPWALRAAYNWRSSFLVTASDCCVGFPVWQKAAGYLDGSIRYRVNDNIELSVQGSNLLKTDTILVQQVDQRGTLLPNEWAQQDRRIQVGIRLKY